MLNLDEKFDCHKLKNTIPNIAQQMKKLHLKVTMEYHKIFMNFVEELASIKYEYQNK